MSELFHTRCATTLYYFFPNKDWWIVWLIMQPNKMVGCLCFYLWLLLPDSDSLRRYTPFLAPFMLSHIVVLVKLPLFSHGKHLPLALYWIVWTQNPLSCCTLPFQFLHHIFRPTKHSNRLFRLRSRLFLFLFFLLCWIWVDCEWKEREIELM